MFCHYRSVRSAGLALCGSEVEDGLSALDLRHQHLVGDLVSEDVGAIDPDACVLG